MMLSMSSSVSLIISVKNMGFENKYGVNTASVDLSHILDPKHKKFAPPITKGAE